MYIVFTQHYQSIAFSWRKYHTYCLLVGLNITSIIRYLTELVKKKMPAQALRVPGVEVLIFQDNRHMKVVRPTHQPPLPPTK